MKYGTDLTPIEQAEQSLLQAIQQQQQTFWYLFIDVAFDVADEVKTPDMGTSANVYEIKEMVDLQHLGPRVMQLHTPKSDIRKTQQLLRTWLTHASGRPMLSLWASDNSAQALAQHMRAWSWARTPDQQDVLLRLADTRSACSLQKTLYPAQWHGLTQPLHSWLYIDRQGKAASIALGAPAAADTPAAQPPIELDEAQVQAMVDIAEPDALLHHVATQMPEFLPQDVSASKMHSYTVWACQLIQENEVMHFADKMTLLVSAYVTRGESLKEQVNLDLLANKRYTAGQLAQHWPAK